MNATFAPVRKSSAATPAAKLSRMLQSMSRRFPQTSLVVTMEGFGVRRIDGSYLHIVCSGRWTDADMRDFLALFATWCAADPRRIRPEDVPLDGVSLRELLPFGR